MKRINQPCFFELSTTELVSANAKSLYTNSSSSHDSKTQETCLTEVSQISSTPQKAFLTVISKLDTQGRAHLKSPVPSLINIFANTFHVKQSPQRAQGFTWNIHNILSYV
jgi:hypothetical protein